MRPIGLSIHQSTVNVLAHDTPVKWNTHNYVSKTSYLPSDLNGLDQASGTSCLAVNRLMSASACDMGKQRPLAAPDQNTFKKPFPWPSIYCSLENQSDIFIRDRDSAYDPLRIAENCGHILIMLIAGLLKMWYELY